MIKVILKWAIIVVLLAILVKDVGYTLIGFYNLEGLTRTASQAAAAAAARGEDEVTAFMYAKEVVEPEGVSIYAYEQTQTTVQLWTESELEGTTVFGLVLKTLQGGEVPVIRRDLTLSIAEAESGG